MAFTDVTRRGRRSRNPVELPANRQHGTRASYVEHRCGCDLCRAWKSGERGTPSARRRGVDRPIPCPTPQNVRVYGVSPSGTTDYDAAIARAAAAIGGDPTQEDHPCLTTAPPRRT
jgi:hypothetical protein